MSKAHSLTRVLLSSSVAALFGCTPHSVQMTPSLSTGTAPGVRGTVSYRDRSALPLDAEVNVWIMDASPGMVTQVILAESSVKTNGRQVPIPFELSFDAGRVVPAHPYAVKAVISSGGQRLYESPREPRTVMLTGPVSVDLILSLVQSEAPAPASLEGTSWRLEDLGGAGVIANVEATLEFLAGGKVAGKGTCNRFFGTLTTNGASLTMSQMGSTRMACTPALNDQESKYLAALGHAQRYQLQGSTLLLTYSGSDKPLRFVRAGQ